MQGGRTHWKKVTVEEYKSQLAGKNYEFIAVLGIQ